MSQVWCNGQWLDGREHSVSFTDRGVMHGLGLFETMLAVDGRPVFAERHLERIGRACGRLGWSVEIPGVREIMEEILVRNDLAAGRAVIRLAVTGGSGPLDDLTSGGDRLVWMTARAAAPPCPGVAVNVSPWVRNERSPLAGMKCASYAENLVALDDARRAGFDETLFFNSAGCLCEGAASNVFLVENGGLHTPPLESGCLPGVTRGVVIELAEKLGVSCNERHLVAADLARADEIFLTSSVRGPVGVSRLADRVFPPGPVTCALRNEWAEAILRETGA